MSGIASGSARATMLAALMMFTGAACFAGSTAPAYRVVDLSIPSDRTDLRRDTVANGISGGTIAGAAYDIGFGLVGAHGVGWFGPAHDHVLLTPAESGNAIATACSDGRIVGYRGGGHDEGPQNAAIWSEHGAVYVNLNPSGYVGSAALGISGDRQVGFGASVASGTYHALLWSGSADSAVDLNGAADSSAANAVFGDHQVGRSDDHAALWSGSAQSRIDLHPAGFDSSEALGVWGDQQVGFAYDNDRVRHAIWWNSTPQSAVVLPAAGYLEPRATAIADGKIIGTDSKRDDAGITSDAALLWLDPAAEPIDLSDFFATRPTHSRAYGIDATGAIVGEADDHAVLWLPVAAAAIPVPSAALTGLALLGLLSAAHWAPRRVTRTACRP